MLRTSDALLVMLVCGATLGAQNVTQPPASPDAVMRQFHAAVETGRWVDAAKLVVPDAILAARDGAMRAARDEAMRAARGAAQPGSMTADMLMQTDSSMPREVAEWMVRRSEGLRVMSGFNAFSYQFAGVHDTLELLALSPLELVARALEAQDFRYIMMRSMREDPSCKGRVTEPPPPHRRELLGVVAHRDTAWAVQREIIPFIEFDPELPIGHPSVAVLVLRDGAWRVVPTFGLIRGTDVAFSLSSCGEGSGTPP